MLCILLIIINHLLLSCLFRVGTILLLCYYIIYIPYKQNLESSKFHWNCPINYVHASCKCFTAASCAQYGIRSNAVNADRIRTNLFDMSLVEERAKSRGLTASEYFASNLLKTEVLAYDVAGAFLNLALSKKTTGGIYTVDGGNIAASPR